MSKLRITDYDFNDVDDPIAWTPDDPSDFDLWITVTVGDDEGGSNFQVHICTPKSIRRIREKRACFVVDCWAGTDDLIARLDEFIAEKTSATHKDPYHTLANHWIWEY